MLELDLTNGISEVHKKEKDADHVVDVILIHYYHYVIGMIDILCKDSYPLLVLSLLKEDYLATTKLKIKDWREKSQVWRAIISSRNF